MKPVTIKSISNTQAEIVIFGEIGSDPFDQGKTHAERVKRKLDKLGAVDEITVVINSPGGNYFDGLGIFNLLRSHKASICVEIEGLAASAAALIAMAGDTIEMRQDSFLMIHRASVAASGNGDDLKDAIELLERIDAQQAQIFARRTGNSEGDVTTMLAAETWLSAERAVELGFADEILSDHAAVASFDLSKFHRTPKIMKTSTKKSKKATAKSADAKNVLAIEQKRRTDIRARFQSHAEAHRPLLDRCLDDPTCSVEKASKRLIKALAENQHIISPQNAFVSAGAPGDVEPGTDDFVSAASDALLIRAGVRLDDPHPGASDIATLSLADLAKACLGSEPRAQGILRRERDPVRAALSTSDFPLILEDSINKMVGRGFENDPASHRQWVRVQSVSDFRPQKRPILGSGPDLDRVLEQGEYKHGAFNEDGTEYSVKKFGKIIDLSWETLKNDNLGIFLQRIPPAMGSAARRLEADSTYALFSDNANDGPTMQDGEVLFHVDHANLVAAQAAFDKSALGEGRLLLRKQTAVGGGLLSLVPRYLIVPAELETDAEILIAAATQHRTGIDANEVEGTASDLSSSSGATPEWIARLELVVEPRLAADAFYLATSSEQVDTVELGVLDDNSGGPQIIQDERFNVDAMQWKVRHVFEPKFLDWRGIVKIPLS